MSRKPKLIHTIKEATRAQKKRIEELLDSMTPIEGELRTVQQCDDCHELFGHRYIPYALGRGYIVDLCLCQCTAHRPFHEVAKRDP